MLFFFPQGTLSYIFRTKGRWVIYLSLLQAIFLLLFLSFFSFNPSPPALSFCYHITLYQCNGFIIRGYYDRVNLGCYNGPHLLVSSFHKQKGRVWGKQGGWGVSLYQPAGSSILSVYARTCHCIHLLYIHCCTLKEFN